MTALLAIYTLGLAIWHAQLWFKGLTPADRDALQAENNRLTAEAEFLREAQAKRQQQARASRPRFRRGHYRDGLTNQLVVAE